MRLRIGGFVLAFILSSYSNIVSSQSFQDQLLQPISTKTCLASVFACVGVSALAYYCAKRQDEKFWRATRAKSGEHAVQAALYKKSICEDIHQGCALFAVFSLLNMTRTIITDGSLPSIRDFCIPGVVIAGLFLFHSSLMTVHFVGSYSWKYIKSLNSQREN
jgi:hypothetical protein